jgi:hypothetical protein
MKTTLRRSASPGFAWRSLLLAAALTAAFPLQAATDSVPQLPEDTALVRRIETPLVAMSMAAPTNEICEPGAKWMRVGFKALELRGYDALTITSSGGDSYTFDGTSWNGRQFSTHALRGDCVQFKPWFGDRNSRFELDGYQFGTKAIEDTTVIVAGAGDICDGSDCRKTADLIRSINPVAVFTAGDNAYGSGTLSEYNGNYNTYWGPFKNYTKPTPGNHEYNTSGASGYFDYFNGSGVANGIAGERGKGYYSWDVGDWHFIALNSNISMSAGSAQETWLRSNLAANTKPCTAAVWHHPLISRGNYTGVSSVQPLWRALYDHKADLILVGHDHNYQRYAKANPSLVAAADGLRQILIGTGGRGFYSLSGSHTLLEKANASTFGVLKLTLSSTGYKADFVPVAGSTFTDTVSATCNRAVSTNPDFSVAAAPASPSLVRGSSTSGTLSVASSGGFAGAVTLSLSGLPSGVTYALGTNPVNVAANATASSALTLNASSTASTGTYTVTVNAVSGSVSRSTAFSLTVTAGGGPSTQIYSNGPLSTGATAKNGTAAPSGTNWSELQNDTGNTAASNGSWGFSANGASYRLADDFTVPSGQSWTLSGIDVYAYKTGASASASPFTSATLQIYRGRPGDSGSTLVCGNTTTNMLTSSSAANLYRILNTVVPTAATPDTTRKIWRNRLAIPSTCAGAGAFTAGTYWIVWGTRDSANGAHYTPSLAIPGARTRSGANARQLNVSSGAWSSVTDSGKPDTAPDAVQELPFEIQGSIQ